MIIQLGLNTRYLPGEGSEWMDRNNVRGDRLGLTMMTVHRSNPWDEKIGAAVGSSSGSSRIARVRLPSQGQSSHEI